MRQRGDFRLCAKLRCKQRLGKTIQEVGEVGGHGQAAFTSDA